MRKEIYDEIGRRAMSKALYLDAAKFLDFIQVELGCSGTTDSRDYRKLDMMIPTSCYTGNFMNSPGCAQALKHLLDSRAGIAAGVTASTIICHIIVRSTKTKPLSLFPPYQLPWE